MNYEQETTPTMIVSRLAHVALSVPDVELATNFYTDIFGLAILTEERGTRYMASGRSATFELALNEGNAVMDHFAFTVCGPAALEEAHTRLSHAGVLTSELDAEPGIEGGIAFALPTGHLMHLVVEGQPDPFVVVPDAALPHHHGVGPVPIEHITLHAHDIRENAEFLIELLDFRLTESTRPPNSARWLNTFLRTGQMHHDLGMIPTAVDRPGLHHLCFAVPSVAELVRTSDLLTSRGIALDASIGRHAAGNNVFLYFKDPFGTRLEVNTDMARVDAAAAPIVRDGPVPFDAWRPGRPPALDAGSPARDGRLGAEGTLATSAAKDGEL